MLTITLIEGTRTYPRRALNVAHERWGTSEIFVAPEKARSRVRLESPTLGGNAPGAAHPGIIPMVVNAIFRKAA